LEPVDLALGVILLVLAFVVLEVYSGAYVSAFLVLIALGLLYNGMRHRPRYDAPPVEKKP